MKPFYTRLISAVALTIVCAPSTAHATERNTLMNIADENARHEACLELTRADAPAAFSEGLYWRDKGGGARARHCVAMALFELEQYEEAASRLETIALLADAGNDRQRARFLAQAASAWMLAGQDGEAIEALTVALDFTPAAPDLLLDRAIAHSGGGSWEDVITDLNAVLRLQPENTVALRLRADALRRTGALDAAEADAQAAIALDPQDIEARVVLGDIRLARRGVSR